MHNAFPWIVMGKSFLLTPSWTSETSWEKDHDLDANMLVRWMIAVLERGIKQILRTIWYAGFGGFV